MRKVATFWNDETKYSLRYLPTSGLARAFTRSASALFQVKRGSSKLPETCKTKTSFCSFLARWAAALGVSTNSTLVPNEPQLPSACFNSSGGSAAPSSPSPRSGTRHQLALLRKRRQGMVDLLWTEPDRGLYIDKTSVGRRSFLADTACYKPPHRRTTSSRSSRVSLS